jgi:Tol biopolymer transport system component
MAEDICTANADGTGETVLTGEPGFCGTPHWSPDGGRIAFTYARMGASALLAEHALTAIGVGNDLSLWVLLGPLAIYFGLLAVWARGPGGSAVAGLILGGVATAATAHSLLDTVAHLRFWLLAHRGG